MRGVQSIPQRLLRLAETPSAWPLGEQQEAELLVSIKEIYEESEKRYGSPRIHATLRKQQVVCSLTRVKKLMRREGIYAVPSESTSVARLQWLW